MKRHHLATLLLLTVAPLGAQPEISSDPCMKALAQGSLEERRARFDQALVLFESARKQPTCEVEAQIGLARTYNSMNDHKEALIAAEWVLDHSDDAELLAEASYEIGRAHHKPGRRMNKDKTAAEEAFRQAVEQSEGRHRGAIRALKRLYEETRQKDQLAELEERFPDVRAATRAKQLRTIAAKPKPKPKVKPEEAGQASRAAPRSREEMLEMLGPAVPGGSRDCSTRKAPAPDEIWELDLPSFCGAGNDDGLERPDKISSKSPKYSREDYQGDTFIVIQFEALVGTLGEVEAVRILRSHSPGMDKKTLDGTCKWEWEPARDAEGKLTRFYTCNTISVQRAEGPSQ